MIKITTKKNLIAKLRSSGQPYLANATFKMNHFSIGFYRLTLKAHGYDARPWGPTRCGGVTGHPLLRCPARTSVPMPTLPSQISNHY